MTDSTAQPGGILFSTFEPSGDALAAGVVAQLRERFPDRPIYALGGPKLEAAGATLIESTTQHAAMGLDTLKQINTHRERVKRLGEWLKEHPIDLLVPTDSPAGNWAICKQVRIRRPNARIVHLVAPQLWAWGSWRIRRLHRLSDHVLCLLPFEPQWFESRDMPATFVGHPVLDPSCHARVPAGDDLPQDGHRLALLPGSRSKEIERNWPTMLDAFLRLRQDNPQLVGVIAAFNDRLAKRIQELTGEKIGSAELADGLHMAIGRTESVLDWSHTVLVASGTATLQVASYLKPMVAMYNVPRMMYYTLKWLVQTKTYTLPNLISDWQQKSRAIPELIPLFGQVDLVVDALRPLIEDESAAAAQRRRLEEVIASFEGKLFSQSATDELIVQGHLK